jgi:hypothetical protein
VASGARSLLFQWKGTEELSARIRQLGEKGQLALAVAAREEAEAILDDCNDSLVPRDTSTLAKSGYATQPERIGQVTVVRVGYGGSAAPYAAAVHENPRAGKTGGVSPSGRRYKTWAKVGRWKYLEVALARAQRRFPRRVARIVRQFWEE